MMIQLCQARTPKSSLCQRQYKSVDITDDHTYKGKVRETTQQFHESFNTYMELSQKIARMRVLLFHKFHGLTSFTVSRNTPFWG